MKTLALALAIAVAPIIAVPQTPSPPGESHLQTIYSFPNGTWVENLAVRENGKLLVTFVTAPEVWQVDPHATPATAELIYRFVGATTVTGITEYAPDVFAVNVGNISLQTLESPPKSWSVHSIDMNKAQGEKRVSKITDLTPAKFLNGNTNLASHEGSILVADSHVGVVYSVSTKTGAFSVAIDEPAFKPNASADTVIGINGVHIAGTDPPYLYFTNSYSQPYLGRIAIDPSTGKATGPVQSIVNSVSKFNGAPDDFSIDTKGNAWLANGAINGLLEVSPAAPDGSEEVAVGGTDSSQPVGATSAQFGRTKADLMKGRLYITTNGGLAAPPPQGVVGGKVFALDTALL